MPKNVRDTIPVSKIYKGGIFYYQKINIVKYLNLLIQLRGNKIKKLYFYNYSEILKFI